MQKGTKLWASDMALTHHEDPQNIKVNGLDFRVRCSALGISLGLLFGQMSTESHHGTLRVLAHELQQQPAFTQMEAGLTEDSRPP